MSQLKEQLNEIKVSSMKSGDKATLGFARNLYAAVRKQEIDTRVDLDDAGFMKIVTSAIKQRRDSIDQFTKGGRDDLVADETAELGFLQTFLPPQMSDEELTAVVRKVVEEVGASSPKDMGKVMQKLMPLTQGKADGKKVSQVVQQLLQ